MDSFPTLRASSSGTRPGEPGNDPSSTSVAYALFSSPGFKRTRIGLRLLETQSGESKMIQSAEGPHSFQIIDFAKSKLDGMKTIFTSIRKRMNDTPNQADAPVHPPPGKEKLQSRSLNNKSASSS